MSGGARACGPTTVQILNPRLVLTAQSPRRVMDVSAMGVSSFAAPPTP